MCNIDIYMCTQTDRWRTTHTTDWPVVCQGSQWVAMKHVYMSVSISVSQSLFVSLFGVSVRLSVRPSVCLSVRLSICLSVHLSVPLSVCLFVCLFVHVCLLVYTDIVLYMYRSIYLCVCPTGPSGLSRATFFSSPSCQFLLSSHHFLPDG